MFKVLKKLSSVRCPFCGSDDIIYKRSATMAGKTYKYYDCLECEGSFNVSA